MKPMLALAWLCATAQAQTTWYVDVNGTPPGAGTSSNPYTSIQYAHDQATTVAGDTLRVRPGTYHENLLLTKGIVVAATQGAEHTLLLPASAGSVVKLQGPAYPAPYDALTLSGFTISGAYGNPSLDAGVRSWHGRLKGCVITGNSLLGVKTDYDTHIESCVILGNTHGVEASTLNDAIWITNSVVQHYANSPSPSYEEVTYCVAPVALPPFLGPGNVIGDPGLWDPAHGDFRPAPGSICIDAGDPALLDPDGSRLDVGVFPFDPLHAPLASYCTGKLNSDGCVPEITGSGLPSATSASPFLVGGQLLLAGKTSLLLYGYAENALPFQGATLCIGGSLHRAGLQLSAGSGPCGGTTSFDFNTRIQSGIDPALVPGKLVFAQWYQRDPFDPAGFASGLTNGLRFGIAP